MFIKPTSDLKLFNACILNERKTLKMITEECGLNFSDLKGKTVLFSEPQDITGEYRCIMNGNNLIGASKYFESGKLDLSGRIPELIIKKAQEFAKKYHPAEIFTMDLCETMQGEVKIVEYNCWNTSGLYNINLVDLFKAIERHYTIKYATLY